MDILLNMINVIVFFLVECLSLICWMDLEVTLYSFASITDKFLIKKFLELQDSFSKQILINLSNLLSDPRLRENVSSFHLKN